MPPLEGLPRGDPPAARPGRVLCGSTFGWRYAAPGRHRPGRRAPGSLTAAVVLVAVGGSGVPVVCLPMLGMSRVATAEALDPALAGWPGLREVYPDLPGNGDSPGEGAADSQTVLDAVCRWVDGHLEGPVLLAGSSPGGCLAAGIARQRPDLARGVLLVCPRVCTGAADRDLPTDEPPSGEQGWREDAPAQLRGHLDRALGRRPPEMVAAVLRALAAGGPGDEQYQDALTDGPGYALPDQAEELTFRGPVAAVVGRKRPDRWPRRPVPGSAALPGHDVQPARPRRALLPYERPGMLRVLTEDWLRRCDA